MSDQRLACIELGGSGAQTGVFDGGRVAFVDGVHVPDGATVALAVPGLIDGDRVRLASSLGWADVDPAAALGLPARPSILLNDAEAAALGEWALRGPGPDGLVYVGLGTGVGGAVVRDGEVVAANLFGHQPGFGDERCLCGRIGCLETVAAGWALPTPIPADRLDTVGRAVAAAISAEARGGGLDVVVAGGMAARYPRLVEAIGAALPGRAVLRSAAPAPAKSAAAWGLRHALGRVR